MGSVLVKTKWRGMVQWMLRNVPMGERFRKE